MTSSRRGGSAARPASPRRRAAARASRARARLGASPSELPRHRGRRRLGAQEFGHERIGGTLRENGQRSPLPDAARTPQRGHPAEEEGLAGGGGGEKHRPTQLPREP